MTEQQKIAEQLMGEAAALGRQGRYEEAIRLCDEAIRLAPTLAEAYFNRGLAKSKLRRHKEAIKDCDEAIRLKPDFANAYNNRGLAKSDLGRHEDAIKDYDEAIRIKPDDAVAYYNRGNAKSDLGRHEEAIKDYDQALRLDQNYTDAYNNRGVAKSDLGRHEDATKDYDEAIRIKPDDAVAYYNRGNAKSNLGRHEDAIKDYDDAIRLDQNYAYAHYGRAHSYFQLKKHEEAYEGFSKAISLLPDSNLWKKTAIAKKAEVEFLLTGFKDAVKKTAEIETLKESGDPFPELIVSEVKNLEIGVRDKETLFEKLRGLFGKIQEVKKKHVVKPDDFIDSDHETIRDKKEPLMVAHYTTMDALRNMLSMPEEEEKKKHGTSNLLRIYNAAYMNDPQEGSILITASKNSKNDNKLLHSFFGEENYLDEHHKLTLGTREFSAYVCSFTLRVDRLDLWRTYGSDGKGFCIAIPFPAFKQRAETALNNMPFGNPAKTVAQGESKKGKETARRGVVPTLYRIKYGDKEAEKTLKALNPFLKAIDDCLRNKKSINKSVSAIVRILLSDILYLYKNEEYQSEKEARILTVFEISDHRLEIDEKNPARIFAESEPFLFSKDGFQIYLGPKVDEKTKAEYELKYRISKAGYRVGVIRSEIQYR